MSVTSSLLSGIGGASLVALAMSASVASAALVTVDEKGTPDPVVGPGSLRSDPTVPGGTPTVAYILPFPTVPGDVVVVEPPVGSTVPASDLLRFVPFANGSELLIYSDTSSSDPADAAADIGLPQNLQTNVFSAVETGLNGQGYTDSSNGLLYTPNVGQPGSLPTGAPGNTYLFISDVPEPGMLFLIPGLAVLLMRNRSRIAVA